MSRGSRALLIASGLVLTVIAAGFARSSAESRCPAPRSGILEREDPRVSWKVAEAPPAPGLLSRTAGPEYRRAAEIALRVEDCTLAEDALEAKLEKMKGEIVEMVMEGTEGSRTCALSALIPSDQFRSFVADLRQMGRVQSERITASKLRSGDRRGSEGEPDDRELSLVSIRMADEKVAPAVLESRGLLASSFDRSASHFLNGMAVLVEGLGVLLPWLLVLGAFLMPGVVISRFRRARAMQT